MDEFMQMDIFFFITSVAVIVFAACAAYISWQISRILKHVEHISEQAALESDAVRADLAEMRADLRHGKGRVKSLFNFFGSIVKRKSKKS